MIYTSHTKTKTTTKTTTSPCRTTGPETHFPGKLHDMLAHVEREGLQSVISWVEDGRAFMIHDPDQLVDILKLFFGQTKYRSFRRQLNHWHFERVLHGPNRGAFEHPFFIRGRKTLCRQRSRHSFEAAAPKRLRMGSQAIMADHMISASINQQQQRKASFTTTSSSSSLSSSLSSSSIRCSLVTGSEQEPSRTASKTVSNMNKQFLSTFIQLSDDNTATSTTTKNNNKSCLEDGDIVPFEGRRFHFLDLGSLDMIW